MESVYSLMKLLEEGCLSTTAVEGIKKNLVLKASKELELYIGRLDNDLSLLQDFLSSLQYLVKHNNSCYNHLIEQGILQLMKVVFKQIHGRVSRDGLSESLQAVIEICTETSNVIADVNTTAKSNVVLELCPHFLDLLQSHLLGFTTRMEVLKSTNMLLEQCPTSVKESFLNSKDGVEKISDLVNLVKTVGDYEFQVGIIECLMRLFPRKHRCQYAEKFFLDQDLRDGFVAIKDKDFETDCRLFLNTVNSKSEDPSEGVFSLPCVNAFVGNKQLRKPSDAGYEEFWVDFNIGSERLTLFCEQDSLYSQGTQLDEDMWETVAIYKTDVQQCCFNEKDQMIELEICLKSPVCDIYPSQHQDVTDNKIRILFLPELEAHIAHAVGYTFNFNERRSKVSTVQTPLQISMKDVQNADSESKTNYAVQNPVIPSPAQTGSQESVSKRHKVSIPSVPMKTPAASPMLIPSNEAQPIANKGTNMSDKTDKQCSKKTGNSKVSASINNIAAKKVDNREDKVMSKETLKDFAVPKTPQKKTRLKSKVKTPVVTVTPPSKKTKKQIVKSDDSRDRKESVTNEYKLDEKEHQDTVIPDSLPLIEDSQNKTDNTKSVKASVSKESDLDDSGIGVDESRSTICSTSVCDMQDTSKENTKRGQKDFEYESVPEVSDEVKPAKKVKGKSKKKVVSEHSIDEADDQSEEKGADLRKTGTTETDQQSLKPLSDNKSINDEIKKSSNNNRTCVEYANFGFDSLLVDETLDRIPDSLEAHQTSNIPTNKTDICDQESNAKGKTSKKSRSNKKGKKIFEKKDDKENISDTGCLSKSESKKTIAVKPPKNGTEILKKKKQTFCDVDSSLKELNDKKGNKSKSGIIEDNVENKHRILESKRKDENNETLQNLYTFPDQDCTIVEPDGAHKNSVSHVKKKKGLEKRNSSIKGEGGIFKKIEKSGRPKQGKYKIGEKDEINDENGIDFKTVKSNCNKDSKRSLRNRSRNSTEIEISGDTDGISSPLLSARSESIVSSDHSQSASVSPLPTEKTPENSPDKIQGNEQKIKSSLKKGKRSANGQQGIKKSRVSFDLPNSGPQEKDSADSQIIEVGATDSQTDNSVENAKTVDSDASDEKLRGEISQVKDGILAGTYNHTDSRRGRSKSKIKPKMQSSEYSKALGEKENSTLQTFVAAKVNTPLTILSSPVSSTESSDSLYIERDNSYNARRYRMENTAWSKSKQRRKSSLNTNLKDLNVTHKTRGDNKQVNKQKPESCQTISMECYTETMPEKNKKSRKLVKQSTNDKRSKDATVPGIDRNKDADNQFKLFETIPDEFESNQSSRRSKHRTVGNHEDFGACAQKLDRQGYNTTTGLLQRTESPMIEEDENYVLKRETKRKESGKADEKQKVNVEEYHEELGCDNGAHIAVVPLNAYQSFDEDEILENNKDRIEKSSNKSKRKNMSYTVKSFEKMECENGYAVSEQSFHTIANTKGKNMVFQMSYLKSRSNVKSKSVLNKTKKSSGKQSAKEETYDPYDFEAQCDNSSMASERIGRKDLSKELNSKHRKTDDKNTSQTKACSAKYFKEESPHVNSQERFIGEVDGKDKSGGNSSKNTNSEMLIELDKENAHCKGKKPTSRSPRKGQANTESLETNYSPDNSLQDLMVNLQDQHSCYQRKPKKTVLVQDKKTNKWYRADGNTVEQEEYVDKKKRSTKLGKGKADFPTVDSFSKSMVEQSPSVDYDTIIIDSSVEESSISQFSKILKEITAGQGKSDTSFNMSIANEIEADDTEIMTPCIIGSISSTPKVGSGKRKHYYPLNISVIKTPQSCKIMHSDSDIEDVTGKNNQTKKRTRRKKFVKYKELSESDTDDGRSECKSRMSTDSISFLDNSYNVSNKSEKSWILERRKTPKLKKNKKTYKASKKIQKGN